MRLRIAQIQCSSIFMGSTIMVTKRHEEFTRSEFSKPCVKSNLCIYLGADDFLSLQRYFIYLKLAL